MKQSRTIYALSAATLLSATVLITACNNDKAADLANSLSKSANNCSTYNTESQGDAENSVVRLGNDYKFNLYFMGRDKKISVWENNGLNDYYEIRFDPLTIVVLGEGGRATDTLKCGDNKELAARCIERLEALLAMTKDARESSVAVGAKLSSGKEMTFKCADEFAGKRIEELKAIRAARN